jgi:hypothetical protein
MTSLLVKTGGRSLKAGPLLLVAASGESADAGALWQHVAEN